MSGISAGRKIAIGEDDFDMRTDDNVFYVDKTAFLSEWYRNRDKVTLITRPRRFGKSLTMKMTERFFSLRYANKPEPFLNLAIGADPELMSVQGTFPVISISFAGVQGNRYSHMLEEMTLCFLRLCSNFRNELNSEEADPMAKRFIDNFTMNCYDSNGDMKPPSTVILSNVISLLCNVLVSVYHRKVMILLDEYDTPLQSAYLNGYWDEASDFFNQFFKKTFKENDSLYQALITGITRVAKESLFSPFNNPVVCSVTSPFYEETFGFTQEEVDSALLEYGMTDKKDEVKKWYDGYRFGTKDGMYNPWSICNLLYTKETGAYWIYTASDEIVSYVIKKSDSDLKDQFTELMKGKEITVSVTEDTTYLNLLSSHDTVWGLLLACGYLKCIRREGRKYTLAIVNHEVMEMMEELIETWFRTNRDSSSYGKFIEALVRCSESGMQEQLSRLSSELLGIHDTSKHEGDHDTENFYHGFVLGLVASLRERYAIDSNRESGYGRYDIMMEPLDKENDNGIVIEFKVFNPEKEKDLEGTCDRALAQIRRKEYDTELKKRGVPQDRIVFFGIGYKGKEVLVKRQRDDRNEK